MAHKKLVYRIYMVKEYKKDGDKPEQVYIGIEQNLYEGEAFATMDTTVYDLDDFKDIHEIYKNTAATIKDYDTSRLSFFEYDCAKWDEYLAKLKREIMAMQ